MFRCCFIVRGNCKTPLRETDGRGKPPNLLTHVGRHPQPRNQESVLYHLGRLSARGLLTFFGWGGGNCDYFTFIIDFRAVICCNTHMKTSIHLGLTFLNSFFDISTKVYHKRRRAVNILYTRSYTPRSDLLELLLVMSFILLQSSFSKPFKAS